jgi:cellulose synthase/poly-beta-1,6-N-acetylglucosamine synthase-like glycosyltransferase/GGDEF domain-containing protein
LPTSKHSLRPALRVVELDAESSLISETRMREEIVREFSRIHRGGSIATLASVTLHELASIRLRVGPSTAEKVLHETASRISNALRSLDLVAVVGDDTILVLMPETAARRASVPLDRLTSDLAAQPIDVDGKQLLATPIMGFCESREAASPSSWLEQADGSRDFAATQLHLRPEVWTPRIQNWTQSGVHQRETHATPERPGLMRGLKLTAQIVATMLLGLALPFVLYVLMDGIGLDITPFVYVIVVVSLFFTGGLIWLEGFYALRAPMVPEEPGEAYPPATAIIAAYLPNEAATILETLQRFLSMDYPEGLQVILAYNSPSPLPVEKKLATLARKHPSFLPFKVQGSNSKAQNVNAALEKATGRFVGVFDADHLPNDGSFQRAWRWLSNGYDVVQGHCMVRNAEESWLARMVAVEFEAIYAVSHPGRAGLHGFGIFGGSNGYWRIDRLHRIRMQSSMLTEDIDSSMRVITTGGKIASDRSLISAELATTTVKQLWNQRMRWAQGWFQVSLRHLIPSLRSPHLSVRQKLGLLHLLLWREAYPWLSLQMLPIIAFWLVSRDINWFVPIFLVTSVLTLSVGPGQAILAYMMAAPEIKHRKSWFVAYLIFASPAYTEMKNVIARVAQLKHVLGERDWRVTPRTSDQGAHADEQRAA